MYDEDGRADGSDDHDQDGLAAAYTEPDPEADLPDPETELPNVPSVDIPDPERSEADVPGELLAGFWTTVLLINVALLTTSLGILLLAFGVERRVGVVLLAVGVLSSLRSYRKYRRLAERLRSGEWSDSEGGGEEGDSDTAATSDASAAEAGGESDCAPDGEAENESGGENDDGSGEVAGARRNG